MSLLPGMYTMLLKRTLVVMRLAVGVATSPYYHMRLLSMVRRIHFFLFLMVFINEKFPKVGVTFYEDLIVGDEVDGVST